ncbi:MAG: DNA-formamidopyrimidine glycosylase family protein, partial [Microgenomates group bacterium]
MPELPEVETIAQRLGTVLPQKSLTSIIVLHPKSFIGEVEQLSGLTVSRVLRKAKILQIYLSDNTYLLIHLKMTGQLIYIDDKVKLGGGHPTADWTRDLPSNHTRVIVSFQDGSNLYFNDQRIFGWAKHVEGDALAHEFRNYGPDIVSPFVTPDYFFQKAQRRSITIKQFLLDNSVAAGVGNIYACDALNLARIHPTRSALSLSKDEMERLLIATKAVIELGIQHGGASIDTYVTAEGLTGTYQNVRRVYAREGGSCPNCGE